MHYYILSVRYEQIHQLIYRWESAKERLKKEEDEIASNLKAREEAYEELYETASLPYQQSVQQPNGKTRNIFSLFK